MANCVDRVKIKNGTNFKVFLNQLPVSDLHSASCFKTSSRAKYAFDLHENGPLCVTYMFSLTVLHEKKPTRKWIIFLVYSSNIFTSLIFFSVSDHDCFFLLFFPNPFNIKCKNKKMEYITFIYPRQVLAQRLVGPSKQLKQVI